MNVIDQNGRRTRVRCGCCSALVEVKTAREKKCGSTCRRCLDAMLLDIASDYRSQVERGIPPHLRTVKAPLDNWVPLRFIDEIRATLLAIDPPRPRLVQQEKTA